MKTKKETCKNCEKQFKDSFKFCPHCGQQAKDELTIKLLFYNTISNYFSFDARFFKSFIPLLIKPGYLASKFIEGKRLLYLHPAQMYLFIAVVFFFLFSFIQRSQVQSLDKTLAQTLKKENIIDNITNETIRDSIKAVQSIRQKTKDSVVRNELRERLSDNKYLHGFSEAEMDSLVNVEGFRKNDIVNFNINTQPIDSLIALDASDDILYKEMGMDDDAGFFERKLYKQGLKFYKSRKGGSILQTFYDTIPIAMFFLLPIFAFLLKLFYKKSGLYAHHLVFSFYYFSFLFTVFSLIIGINFIVDIPNWIDWLVAFSTFLYLFLALRRFYNQPKLKTFVKSSLVSFLFLLFVAPLTAFILGVFAFLFY